MPVERVNKEFKDISMSFQVNPLNNDLITLRNETSIARSIRNLILTSKGERLFNEDLGSRVSDILFENINDISASILRDEIGDTITRFEPRVLVEDVIVRPNYDNSEFVVTISYKIVGIDVPAQRLEFALQPAR